MNIESILTKIYLFEELVIDSGFKRDLNDFYQAIQQAHNRNLVFMKELSIKIKEFCIFFENNSLHSELNILLNDTTPFTELNILERLDSINSNSEIAANEYLSELSLIINEIVKHLTANQKEISTVKRVFSKYVEDYDDKYTDSKQTLMSLIFKDLKTTGTLKQFAKILDKWNRTLSMYHTLLKSESPKEISLVEIQNGSIDVIFNIDLDVALDLTELVTTGLKAYGGYLLYKTKLGRDIIASYMGNKELIKSEELREKLMLENIKDSIKEKALEQHREKIQTDGKIEITGIDVKIDDISKVLTEHIVRGNEIKLLNPPKEEEQDQEEEQENKNLALDLRENTAIIRERFKKLDSEQKVILLDKYTIKEEE
jgi:hypothetical protein